MPISVSSDESDVEHLQYKLVLLGAAAVGKTSVVKQLTQHIDSVQTYTPTVGAEFSKAEVQITDDIHATLQVWDIGSHVSSVNMAANYLHGCDAVLVVFDAAQKETYAEACEWVELLQQMFHETALPYIALIANKLDDFSLLQAASDQLHRITADIPQAYSYTVSAKTGANIHATFLRIAADLAGVPLPQQEMDARCQTYTSTHTRVHNSNQGRQQHTEPVGNAGRADTAAAVTCRAERDKKVSCCGLYTQGMGLRTSARVASNAVAVKAKRFDSGTQQDKMQISSNNTMRSEQHSPLSCCAPVFGWLSFCSCCCCCTSHVVPA